MMFFLTGCKWSSKKRRERQVRILKSIATVTVINVTMTAVKIIIAMILIIHRMSIGSRDLSWRHKEGLLLPENKMMYADSSIGEGMDITIQVASRA